MPKQKYSSSDTTSESNDDECEATEATVVSNKSSVPRKFRKSF